MLSFKNLLRKANNSRAKRVLFENLRPCAGPGEATLGASLALLASRGQGGGGGEQVGPAKRAKQEEKR